VQGLDSFLGGRSDREADSFANAQTLQNDKADANTEILERKCPLQDDE